MAYGNKHPEAAYFQAQVTIEVTAVNKYGDDLQTGRVVFKVPMKGKLSDILARVEAISEGG